MIVISIRITVTYRICGYPRTSLAVMDGLQVTAVYIAYVRAAEVVTARPQGGSLRGCDE